MTRISSRTGRVTAAAVLTALVAVVPSAAFAQTSPTPTTGLRGAALLTYCHTRADAEISRRLATLSADLTLVNSATHLAPGDRPTLVSLITGDQSGLSQLKTTIDATTDVTTCRTEAMTIVTGYRIYVLVEPKIHLTIAADRIEAAGDLFNRLSARLQAAINNAKARGKDVSGAQAALDDLNAKVAAAQSAAGPVPGEVLALQPAGYPANRATLVSARAALETARSDLRAARADAAAVVAALR